MRSTKPPAEGDLTTRARIRDAAITRFAKDGFGASIRTIADDAHVSPGLVIHHFGSKDQLREECDHHILGEALNIKISAMQGGSASVGHDDGPGPAETIGSAGTVGPETKNGSGAKGDTRSESLKDPPANNGVGIGALLSGLEPLDESVAYLIQALLAGGEVAKSVIQATVEASQEALSDPASAQIFRPTSDPEARARYLAYLALGVMVMARLANPDAPPSANLLADLTEQHLEILTHGALANDALLKSYQSQQEKDSSK
ncbi:MAG: TetR family transcriptional regulator [Promicromonosporaceae bacterium]|nr:TetR family transcriptional regulator [Promicromonosporaceae bacterium]